MGKHETVKTGAIAEVWRLLKQGIDIPAAWHAPLQEELHELAQPYLAILMYKREKFGAGDPNWTRELNEFVDSKLWPHVASSEMLGGRNEAHVAELMDGIVAAELRRERERGAPLPLTSRFDTSWAT
ncbi:MAG TPA: hypothetical protein VGG36_04625 [Rhizomicrobium sp.]|jgi:hypothetical protein